MSKSVKFTLVAGASVKFKWTFQRSRKLKIYQYNSFTTEKGRGNPAGVVYLGKEIVRDEEMQAIAKRVGFNETVFIFESDRADFRFRFFTPGHEIALCGHATIAAMGYLNDRNGLPGKIVKVETNVGIIELAAEPDEQGRPSVVMQQDNLSVTDFGGSVADLCSAIGITVQEIDRSLPIVYGSTGSWTLLVPIKREITFKKMVPSNELFPSILKELPRSSVHPFCLERFEREKTIYARHFSSPYSLTVEDPVTGTASGVIGEYLLKMNKELPLLSFVVEQGKEVGRPGKVQVFSERNKKVRITGNYVMNGEVLI